MSFHHSRRCKEVRRKNRDKIIFMIYSRKTHERIIWFPAIFFFSLHLARKYLHNFWIFTYCRLTSYRHRVVTMKKIRNGMEKRRKKKLSVLFQIFRLKSMTEYTSLYTFVWGDNNCSMGLELKQRLTANME